MSKKSKPGDEGLPYKSAESVVGGPLEDQPKAGLGSDQGVKGGPSLKVPKGK